MKKLFSKTKIIIDEELGLINEKIKGSNFLEILKFKILNRLKQEMSQLSIKEFSEKSLEYSYEDDFKKLLIQLEYYKLSQQDINVRLNKNLLIICINKDIKIEIFDIKINKNVKIDLIPFAGINLPETTTLNMNISENGIVLKIYLENKNEDIEN